MNRVASVSQPINIGASNLCSCPTDIAYKSSHVAASTNPYIQSVEIFSTLNSPRYVLDFAITVAFGLFNIYSHYKH